MRNRTFLIGKKDVNDRNTFSGEGKDEESARKRRNLTLFLCKNFQSRLLHLSQHSKRFLFKAAWRHEADGPMRRKMTFKSRLCYNCWKMCSYIVFAHVTRSHICIMIQRRHLHKNRVQSPKEHFTPPTWPPFLCLPLQHGHCDIMWTHAIVSPNRPFPSSPQSLSFKASLVRNLLW